MAGVRLFRPNDILVEVFNGNADRDTFQDHHLSCSEGMELPEVGAFSSEEIYLIVVVGAGVLLGSLVLVRILGVKTKWI